MNLTQSLDLVVSRTGVERYRYLCLDHPSPKVRAEYTALILRLAAEPDPPLPDITASLAEAAAQPVRLGRPCGSC